MSSYYLIIAIYLECTHNYKQNSRNYEQKLGQNSCQNTVCVKTYLAIKVILILTIIVITGSAFLFHSLTLPPYLFYECLWVTMGWDDTMEIFLEIHPPELYGNLCPLKSPLIDPLESEWRLNNWANLTCPAAKEMPPACRNGSALPPSNE